MSYKACPLHINHGLASVVYTMFREVTVDKLVMIIRLTCYFQVVFNINSTLSSET